MSPGQPCFDLDPANAKSLSFIDFCRRRDRLARRRKYFGAGFFAQPRQIRDVIGMSMSKHDHFDGEIFLGGQFQHGTRICAGVECDCVFRFGIPNKIRIHQHAVVVGSELGQPIEVFDCLRLVVALGEINQRVRIKI